MEGVELVAAVSCGEQVLPVLRRRDVDVVLLDVDMPGMGGIETAQRIFAQHPEVVVVMLTAFEQPNSLADALAAGARGFLTKDVPVREIVARARRALAGEVVMGAQPTAILASAYARAAKHSQADDFADRAALLPERLVPVLDLLIMGASNREIAEELHLSEGTVKVYVSRILEETGCENRTEVAIRALRTGFDASRQI